MASFVGSRWSQSTVSGQACYNYYTPPYAAGSASNYVCGCVATAMSQLMRYWLHPTAGIGVNSYYYYINGYGPYWGNTRGGNGAGSAYDWGSMVLDPKNSGVNAAQRAAIGALTYDAGLSVHMNYAAGGSGADTLQAATAFTGTFGYTNAIKGYNSGSNLSDTDRNAMVNPNLHAQYPVLFGIEGTPGGHAIVCDGYGYESSTMYHHLNLGWAGSSDAWYNLPNIDIPAPNGPYTSVYKCIYNVYPSGSGEIIAGRVTNTGGSPLSGVTVSATGGYSTTTDANGIYALPRVASGTTFTVTASKSGYASSSQSVTTGTSSDYSNTTGNKWPIDFTLGVPVIPLAEALDNTQLSFATYGNANWYGQNTTWYYGGSSAQSGRITAGQSTALQTTVVGPGTLSFYWKVSCEPGYGEYFDLLRVWIDSTSRVI